MKTSTPIRVGIVGCGYQGGVLAQSIVRGNALQVTACADPDQPAAARVAAIGRTDAVFGSVEEMLEKAEVEAVLVATSHQALFPCALAAITAGKHVLCEKPVGIEEKEAARLEEAVAHARVCFMAGYSLRYAAGLQVVHDLLQAGAVGDIKAITGSIGTGPMSAGWKAKLETGGGPMLYMGSHLVDQVLWCLGDDPVEVFADIRCRGDTRADETTVFQLRCSRGAVAQGLVTQTAPGFFNNLDIFGRQGSISLRGSGFLHYSIEVTSTALAAYAQPAVIHVPQVDDVRILMHLPQLAEFAEAIHARRQPSCTLADGRRVLRVIDAFAASARLGHPVRVGYRNHLALSN